jgi:hypothetical protein
MSHTPIGTSSLQTHPTPAVDNPPPPPPQKAKSPIRLAEKFGVLISYFPVAWNQEKVLVYNRKSK